MQSLRNPQSVVGHIFPADLFLGAGAGGVPVVIGDEVSLKARGPLAGWAVGVETWTRSTRGQLMVAPFEAGPFARGRFGEGSGQARGVTLDAERSAARAIVLASYAWQAVSARYDGGSYAPEHGARHQASLGLTLLPSPSTSIRLSALGAAGRRSSAADGALEWEACNLWDRGCEFAGAPDADPTRVGARRLPPYLRVDLSARRVLTRRILARDGEVAVFGTLSNLLNRRNVLTYADAQQGSRPLEMRPRAPVVIGLEWVF